MRRVLEAEDEENNVVHPWKYVQTTWATSEDKAINNARYNLIGKVSQYLPVVVSGHWEYWLEWKALERRIGTARMKQLSIFDYVKPVPYEGGTQDER